MLNNYISLLCNINSDRILSKFLKKNLNQLNYWRISYLIIDLKS